MIERIAEHSVETDLLTFGSKVLDLGCRGFQFSKAMYDMKCQVFSVDIDELPLSEYKNEGGIPLGYLQVAVSDFNGMVGISKSDDPQATKMNRLGTGIECVTLETLSSRFGVEMWDVIKMDIEGGEYDVIMSLTKAPAKQLSVEFHLHTGCYKIFEMNAMENKMKALGYEQAKHEMTQEHGAGDNFWDSLFILK